MPRKEKTKSIVKSLPGGADRGDGHTAVRPVLVGPGGGRRGVVVVVVVVVAVVASNDGGNINEGARLDGASMITCDKK